MINRGTNAKFVVPKSTIQLGPFSDQIVLETAKSQFLPFPWYKESHKNFLRQNRAFRSSRRPFCASRMTSESKQLEF